MRTQRDARHTELEERAGTTRPVNCAITGSEGRAGDDTRPPNHQPLHPPPHQPPTTTKHQSTRAPEHQQAAASNRRHTAEDMAKAERRNIGQAPEARRMHTPHCHGERGTDTAAGQGHGGEERQDTPHPDPASTPTHHHPPTTPLPPPRTKTPTNPKAVRRHGLGKNQRSETG